MAKGIRRISGVTGDLALRAVADGAQLSERLQALQSKLKAGHDVSELEMEATALRYDFASN